MVSKLHTSTVAAINPEELRVERDRQIAVAFVAKGQSKAAAKEIHQETGVPLRTVYRAIARQLSWALNQEETPASDTGPGPCTTAKAVSAEFTPDRTTRRRKAS